MLVDQKDFQEAISDYKMFRDYSGKDLGASEVGSRRRS